MTPQQYIENLRPSASGLLAIVICFFIFPLIADLFVVANAGKIHVRTTVRSIQFNGYLYYAPRFLAYLIGYFLFLKILFHFFKYSEY